MGLIVHDSIVINQSANLSLTELYVNVTNINIFKNSATYKIEYQYQSFVNKSTRDENKSPLLINSSSIIIDTAISDLYNLIYTDLKSKYIDCSDA